LPASAKKVQDAARALGSRSRCARWRSPTRTAEEAPRACGVTVGQIVKSLVFLGSESGRPYLLLVSGANRVNEKDVARHLGEKLKRPDATRCARSPATRSAAFRRSATTPRGDLHGRRPHAVRRDLGRGRNAEGGVSRSRRRSCARPRGRW
jgi:hypothetical protein